MSLILKDLVFEIDEATLCGGVPDPYWMGEYHPGGDPRLGWMLDILLKPKEVEDSDWEPRVYHDSLHFPVRKWVEIAGQVVEWESAFDENGEPNGCFYVFQHEDISRSRLEFLDRKHARILIYWEGLCNVFGTEEYGEDVPFSLNTWATFTEITVRGSEADSDKTLRDRLSLYLDLDCLVQHPIHLSKDKYESGVRMAHSLFTPKV